MTSTALFRLSGLSVLLGAALSILSSIVSAFFYGDPTKFAHNPVYIAAQALNAIAGLFLVLGIPGVFARQAQGFGVIGLVGLVLLVVAALCFPVFFGLTGAVVFTWLADQAPKLVSSNSFPPGFFALFLVGGLSFVIACILWAIQLIRRRVEPRWAGFVLVLAAVVQVATFPLPMATNVFISLIQALSGILISVGIGALGYYTWTMTREEGRVARAAGTLAT